MKKIPDKSILKKEFTIPFFNMNNIKKILKKNRKKSHIYKRKRKTFTQLFTKNVIIGLLLTAVFAVGLFQYGKMIICNQAELNVSEIMHYIRDSIERETNSENPDYKKISHFMKTGSGCTICLDEERKYQISPYNVENCHELSCITDEDGNILYSSRMTLEAYMEFYEKDYTAIIMTCDTENKDIPTLQQFEEDYISMFKKARSLQGNNSMEDYSAKIIMKSAYVNREEKTFIPHETDISIIKSYFNDAEPDKIIETKSYIIDIPENYEDYELIEFDLSGIDRYTIKNDTYPRYFALDFFGTDKKWFDDIKEKCDYNSGLTQFYSYDGNTAEFQQNANIYIDGKHYVLSVLIQMDLWNEVTKPLYLKIVIIFLLIMLFISFLTAWRKNVKNQADYMFEDYQKNLTDSLAHDLKTPLTVIGGYAENILSGGLSADETNKYLKSIMESVSYTDSIITRTLELNRMNKMNGIHKENTNINSIVEKSVEKYSITLDEKNITVSTDGQAEIYSNVHLLETTVENLVSNAVKYASENGKINISISNECLSISNTTDKKVDIEKVKKPFAKGDKARSNRSGSGLGLAIAEKSAYANGFKLVLSCTDSEFTAKIKF